VNNSSARKGKGGEQKERRYGEETGRTDRERERDGTNEKATMREERRRVEGKKVYAAIGRGGESKGSSDLPPRG